jgi:hypothetical protein
MSQVQMSDDELWLREMAQKDCGGPISARGIGCWSAYAGAASALADEQGAHLAGVSTGHQPHHREDPHRDQEIVDPQSR